MNIIFNVTIFIIGAFLGSLFATIIKRMSNEKRLFFMHSYCNKCGEKLKNIEKIPILSYIFLKGKCKHCKKPIEVKYICLEIITGFLFLCTAHILNIYDLNIHSLISFIFIIMYFAYIIIASGVDIEKRKMPPTLLAYGIIISIAYIIYLWFMQYTTIYVSAIYLVIMIFLLLLNILNAKKRAQSSYIIDLLTMLLIMLIFTGEIICILTISGTILSIALYLLIKKVNQLKQKGKKTKKIFSMNMRIVFIMGLLNILTFLILVSANKN